MPSFRLHFLGTISLLILVLVACGSSSSETTTATPSPPSSRWGGIITIAQAEQSNAPAILPLNDAVITAWITRTEDTIIQQLAQVSLDDNAFDENPLESYPQPFVLVYPHAQTLMPSTPNVNQLLWLDAQHDNLAEGKRLWVAPINDDLFSERLQTMVSDIRVNDYASLTNPNGSLIVVYSGGLVAEPSLYMQTIDSVGRPRLDRQTLIFNADYPVLLRTNDRLQHLFWIRPSDARVFYAQLVDTGLEDIIPIGDSIDVGLTERLVEFTVAVDRSHFYFFWTIDRMSGMIESWYATMPLNGDTMTTPQRLGITVTPDSRYETGFNGGAGQSATLGETWLRWTTPLIGQFDRVAVTAQVDESLAMIYFEEGAIAGYQAVVALKHDLVGFPQVQTDVNRHLYLAWSEPTTGQFANLNLTMTR